MDDKGLSIVELMVGVAIGGIALIASIQVVQIITESRWQQASYAFMMDDMETFSKMIRKDLPRIISAFDPYTDPTTNPAIWDCPEGGPCKFNPNAGGNGIGLLMNCMSQVNATVRKPDYSTASFGANCSSCPAGHLPQMAFSFMKNGAWMTDFVKFAPNYNRRESAKTQSGIIGMHFCFRAPPYQENEGSAASPQIRTKYDHWEITLIPYYFSKRVYPNWTDSQVKAAAKTAPQKLIVGPFEQLGDIKIIP